MQLEIEAELSFFKSKVVWIECTMSIISKCKEVAFSLELDPNRFDDLADYLASQHTKAKIELERLQNSLDKGE